MHGIQHQEVSVGTGYSTKRPVLAQDTAPGVQCWQGIQHQEVRVGRGYSIRRSVLARDTAPGEEINLKYLTKSNITNLEGKK